MLHKLNVEEKPEEFGAMTLDRWTDSYRDRFNNIWVLKRHGRKQWEMCERQAGNVTYLHSRHRDLENALDAANALYADRHPWDVPPHPTPAPRGQTPTGLTQGPQPGRRERIAR